jgi:hypothetical protein
LQDSDTHRIVRRVANERTGKKIKTVRLRATVFNTISATEGVGVIIKQLSKSEAVLDMPQTSVHGLSGNGEAFAMNVELPANNQFDKRCLRCLATLSSITLGAADVAEVRAAIHEMSFQPESGTTSRVAGNRLI